MHGNYICQPCPKCAPLLAAAPDMLEALKREHSANLAILQVLSEAYDRFTDNDMVPANSQLKKWLASARVCLAHGTSTETVAVIAKVEGEETMKTNEQTAIELLRLAVEHCEHCDGNRGNNGLLTKENFEFVTAFLDVVERTCRLVAAEKETADLTVITMADMEGYRDNNPDAKVKKGIDL